MKGQYIPKIFTCAMCQQKAYMNEKGDLRHFDDKGHDHVALRQREDEQAYPPYDPAEQDNGSIPGDTYYESAEFSVDNETIRSLQTALDRNKVDVDKSDAASKKEMSSADSRKDHEKSDAVNPYVPLMDGAEDYHQGVADMLKVDVKVRWRTRLFIVYVAALALFLLAATATYALLRDTPLHASWKACLAYVILFKLAAMFAKWKFRG